MEQYRVKLMLLQIDSHIETLSLPLSDSKCVFAPASRTACRRDIIGAIAFLYVRSLIDTFKKDELLASLSDAFVRGGL